MTDAIVFILLLFCFLCSLLFVSNANICKLIPKYNMIERERINVYIVDTDRHGRRIKWASLNTHKYLLKFLYNFFFWVMVEWA